MKKFLTIIALCLLALVICVPTSSYAAIDYQFSQEFDITAITEENIRQDIIDFVYGEGATTFDDNGERVDRTAATDGELKARDYLLSELREIFGLAADEDLSATNYVQTQEINFQTSAFAAPVTTYNVIGYKKAVIDTTDYIVIGAHYDNFYGYADGMTSADAVKSHGIYDNASGVVGVLNIAKLLQTKDLNVDVYYAFFGAEELGKYGSRGFYDGFVKKYEGDMKLMINLDSIGNGDNLYMYADEIKTVHEDYFAEASKFLKKNGGAGYAFFEEIKTSPKNKKVDYFISSGEIDYSHMGLNSDNSSFMGEGNNVITFFSGDWGGNNIGMYESSKNENLMHTKNDNLVQVDKLYGDVFYARIKQVVYTCATVVSQDDFIKTMDESSKTSGSYIFFTNSMYINIILAALIIIAYVIFRTYIKKYKLVQKDGSWDKLKKAVLENDIDAIYQKPEEDVTEIVIEDDKKDNE